MDALAGTGTWGANFPDLEQNVPLGYVRVGRLAGDPVAKCGGLGAQLLDAAAGACLIVSDLLARLSHRYTQEIAGHSQMLIMHAGQGMDDDLVERFIDGFISATRDAEIPATAGRTMIQFMEVATAEVRRNNLDNPHV